MRPTTLLKALWPARGPRWDGLIRLAGAAGEPGVLLIEAKAYPSEAGSACRAEAESRTKIREAFLDVQAHMNIAPRNWTKRHYQFANRLAHLWFMNERAKIPTWLLLLNFVDDRSHRPTSRPAWHRHHRRRLNWAGLRDDTPLRDRIVVVDFDAPRCA